MKNLKAFAETRSRSKLARHLTRSTILPLRQRYKAQETAVLRVIDCKCIDDMPERDIDLSVEFLEDTIQQAYEIVSIARDTSWVPIMNEAQPLLDLIQNLRGGYRRPYTRC